MRTVLPASFYDRDPVLVARDLLGKRLVRSYRGVVTAGIIVETEAYLPGNDPACHAARGRTNKNATMFGPPGLAYVYPIHASYCLNAVTLADSVPSAVLIRAVEPTDGLPAMQRRRRTSEELQLTRGPSRLCQAMAIGRETNGQPLTAGNRIWIEETRLQSGGDFQISVSPRIGVTAAEQLLLRFFVDGNRFVSGLRRHHSVKKVVSSFFRDASSTAR